MPNFRKLLLQYEGALLPDLPSLRDKVVKFCAIYTLVIGSPLIGLLIYRAVTVQWLWSTNIQIAAYATLALCVALGKRVSTPWLATVILGVSLLGGISGSLFWGLFANDTIILVGTTALAAIFFGTRISLAVLLFATASFLGIGSAYVSGKLDYHFEEVAYMNTIAPWISRSIHVAMVGVLVSLSVSWITKSLQKTISTLTQREADLEHSYQTLKQQAVQLEEQAAKLEEQAEVLKEQRDKAEAASRAKDQFLSVVSHELRTPLNPVIGFLDILQNENELDEESRNQLQLMQQSSEHLLKMIDQIVDYSELDRGELAIKPQRTRLEKLKTETIFRLANDAKANDLELKVDTSPEPGFDLSLDKKRILQVVTELVQNSIKFTRKGYIQVAFQLEPGAVDKQHLLRIVVTDTGSGIPQEKLASIFDPFSQVENDRTRTTAGFGLGLAFCEKVITSIGGSIAIVSELGTGTQVTVEFPVATLAPESDRAIETATKKKKKFDSPLEILVVEDDYTNQRVVTTLLKRLGAETTCADNGRIALEKLSTRKFDAILMDLSMPEMDGLTATRQIRKNPKLSDIPIFALTAHSFSSSEDQCMEAGMEGFLTKPVKQDHLLSALSKLAQQKATLLN